MEVYVYGEMCQFGGIKVGTRLCSQWTKNCFLWLKNVLVPLTPSLLMVINKCIWKNDAIDVSVSLYSPIQSLRLFFPFIIGSLASFVSHLRLFVSFSPSSFFPPIFVVLQATFPEQPQEPSYIKLQHKDDVRIMNPHLHWHLYSDLPGYKLGRSSGILSRGFHCKLCVLQLLSRFSHFCARHVPVCIWSGRWSLVATWSHWVHWPSCSFSIWCQHFRTRCWWHVTGVLTPASGDRVKEFFKQTVKHGYESKQIPCINWRVDFRALVRERPKQNICNHP